MTSAQSGASPVVTDVTRVLVAVPTLNEELHIGETLSTLLKDTSASLDLQLVVADGGSTDATRSIVEQAALKDPRITLVHNPERLQSAGVNLVVQRFGRSADVLIRCDAHSVYPPEFCAELVQSLKRTGADAVVVPMDSLGRSSRQEAIAWLSNSPLGTGGSAHRAGRRSGFVDHGHHAAFRLASFRRVGGYDPTFSHNEDAELDCRQRAMGAKIYLDSELRIGYFPRDSLGALWRQYYRYGAGRARTVRKHPSSVRLRQLAVPANMLLMGLAVLLSRWLPALLVWPLFYLAAVGAVTVRIALQKRALSGLLVAPAAVVMHQAWGLGFLSSLARPRARFDNSLLAARERRRPPELSVVEAGRTVGEPTKVTSSAIAEQRP